MSHLGRWLSALIDGELEPAERDRVLNHLAGCQPCLHEATAMRALKRRLTALGEAEGSDTAIASRLIELASGDHKLSDSEGLRGPLPGRCSARSRSRHLMPTWLIYAGLTGTAIAVFGFAAFLLGSGQADPAPKVTPSVDSYLLQHYYDTGVEPAGGLRSGLSGPSLDNPAMLDADGNGTSQASPAPSADVAAGGQFFGQFATGVPGSLRSLAGRSAPGSGSTSAATGPAVSAPGTGPTATPPIPGLPIGGSHAAHPTQ
jgi:hypothetical protein